MVAARALLMASAREGWGLVVTECNACGTPAIVYDVPGLRDSVRHMETGLVVVSSSAGLAGGMLSLVEDPALYRQLQENALRWGRSLTFDGAMRAVEDAIGQSVA
jgi:glycosyltransferase involved in cell wall biosynthesis